MREAYCIGVVAGRPALGWPGPRPRTPHLGQRPAGALHGRTSFHAPVGMTRAWRNQSPRTLTHAAGTAVPVAVIVPPQLARSLPGCASATPRPTKAAPALQRPSGIATAWPGRSSGHGLVARKGRWPRSLQATATTARCRVSGRMRPERDVYPLRVGRSTPRRPDGKRPGHRRRQRRHAAPGGPGRAGRRPMTATGRESASAPRVRHQPGQPGVDMWLPLP